MTKKIKNIAHLRSSVGKRKIKVQALKTFKKEQLRGREKNMKGYVKIYATKYIYPFGPPTLSRQKGGGRKRKTCQWMKIQGECLESTSKNKNGKNFKISSNTRRAM